MFDNRKVLSSSTGTCELRYFNWPSHCQPHPWEKIVTVSSRWAHRELTVTTVVKAPGPMITAQPRLGEVTAQSRRGHSSVTARSQLSHGKVTAQSRLSHSSVTARSQLSHGEVTAQSRLGHSSVTARSQLNHGIFSMITAQSRPRSRPSHGWLWPFWSPWAHGELTVSWAHGEHSRWPFFFSHGQG